MGSHPNLRYERKLWRDGLTAIAGVDEAGVGPMAGPVVAAAVIFEPEVFIRGVNDSKQLKAEEREELFVKISERAIAIGVGVASHHEIDEVNIFWATMAASARAVLTMLRAPDHVLVDGRLIPELSFPQTRIVGGDRKSFSIAAASIVAKVTRDRMMVEYDSEFPAYGFAQHKGYCTPDHFATLERFGPSPIHRRSFAPVWQAAQRKLF
ncbi:MAG TPA: ribonuclease HII [Candidatus Binataceae bacterium]|nr:ribonuclease HII [Candidatus Binataceae bacterium]